MPKILFEKPQNLQRMYELISFCHPVILEFLIATIFVVTGCKGLKLAQTALLNQLLSRAQNPQNSKVKAHPATLTRIPRP